MLIEGRRRDKDNAAALQLTRVAAKPRIGAAAQARALGALPRLPRIAEGPVGLVEQRNDALPAEVDWRTPQAITSTPVSKYHP